jgi:hypothetical protein
VCNFCCSFADPDKTEKLIIAHGCQPGYHGTTGPSTVSSMFVDSGATSDLEIEHPLVQEIGRVNSDWDTTTAAMGVIIVEMEKNRAIADLVEVKLATEEMLVDENVISELTP